MAQVQTAIDPRLMSFRDWAVAMCAQNPNLPRPTDESGWRGWAAQALQYEPDWPDARNFPDWRSWAVTCLGSL